MTLEEYFQQPDAQRILLIEITRKDELSTTYYLSDDSYTTEPTDTPPNRRYANVIGGTGLGDIRRSINDPFSGQASTGFGTITLADDLVTFTNTMTSGEATIQTPRGAVVSAFLAGPVPQFSRASAMPLLTGTVGRSGGDSTGTKTFEITDGSDFVRNRTIEVDQKPIAYGFVRNITPRSFDPSLLQYYVNDGPIEAVTAVYDQGALLSPTQYVVDVATGLLTLLVMPVGQLTADVQGTKAGGLWLQSTEQIIGHLLGRAGLSLPQTYSIPSGLIGLYIDETTQLGSLLNALLAGVAGYWLIGANNTFVAAQHPVPGLTMPVAMFTETELIGEVTFQNEDRMYQRVNFSYRKNWTQYQSRGGAAADQAEFSQLQFRQSSVTDPTPDAELEYQDSPQIDTLFDGLSDAQAVANRVLEIYSIPRQLLSLSAPYSATLKLGDEISVMFNGLEFNGAVISLADVFDGSYPIQQVEMLA